MGAYSPVPAAAGRVDELMGTFVAPVLEHLAAMGVDYRGVLYAGLMLTPDGPRLVEYNVRFGDPEAQVVLPRLLGDAGEMLLAAATGAALPVLQFADDACVTVVLATEGYPVAPYRTGDPIDGLDRAAAVDGVTIFHAGTARDAAGRLVTAGGRVLDVTATGPTIPDARATAYEAAARIGWPGISFRRDIAAHAA
jgi:phosphoribosylamine--glycine ligase